MYALIKNEEVTKMHEIINKIVQQNQSLFGTNPKIDKINIGFTIYILLRYVLMKIMRKNLKKRLIFIIRIKITI